MYVPMKMPWLASITFEEAAATPQSAALALQGIRDKGQVQAGQKVLINGAGGGVGTFALQIAKLYGAEVTGVDSTEKLAMMRSIGADYVMFGVEPHGKAPITQKKISLKMANIMT